MPARSAAAAPSWRDAAREGGPNTYPLPWILSDATVERIERLVAQCAAIGIAYGGWAITRGGQYAVDLIRPGGKRWTFAGSALADTLDRALEATADAS